MKRLDLNQFLRACIVEKVDFSRIKLRRAEGYQIWEHYFPKGKSVEIVYKGDGRFYLNNSGWNCAKGMGGCEILSISLTRRGVVVNLGEGWR